MNRTLQLALRIEPAIVLNEPFEVHDCGRGAGSRGNFVVADAKERVIARCETQDDAELVCAALNEAACP